MIEGKNAGCVVSCSLIRSILHVLSTMVQLAEACDRGDETIVYQTDGKKALSFLYDTLHPFLQDICWARERPLF